MRTIVVLNPKGGCGKSTIATNISAYFAQKGKKVTLADCDPQGSSQDWLSVRPESAGTIYDAALSKGSLQIPEDTEVLIFDTPAGVDDERLNKFLSQAQTMIMPVMASPVDIRAAERFLKDLLKLG